MHHLPAKQLEKAQVNFCFLLKGQILAMSNFTTFKYFKFDLHRNKKNYQYNRTCTILSNSFGDTTIKHTEEHLVRKLLVKELCKSLTNGTALP